MGRACPIGFCRFDTPPPVAVQDLPEVVAQRVRRLCTAQLPDGPRSVGRILAAIAALRAPAREPRCRGPRRLDPSAHRVGSLSIRQVLHELQHRDQRQGRRGEARTPLTRVQLGKRAVREQLPEPIAQPDRHTPARERRRRHLRRIRRDPTPRPWDPVSITPQRRASSPCSRARSASGSGRAEPWPEARCSGGSPATTTAGGCTRPSTSR